VSEEHVSDEQLSLLLDGRLSLAAREAVVAHIRRCPGCAERHDRWVELTATLRLEGAREWSPALTASTLTRLGPRARRGRSLRPSRRRGRDWSLPLAALLALLGGLALIMSGGGSLFALAPTSAGDFVPVGALVSGRPLVLLVGAVLVGLVALPLSRSR
jgi:anti-sigma factor RsiW